MLEGMARLAASDCPSDWGWKAVVMCSLVPIRRMSSCQNVEVKTGSRSDTMDWGTPCRRTMSAKNAWVTDSAEYGCAKGIKWQYLLNLFTTVRITDLPRTRGRASTKSRAMSRTQYRFAQYIDINCHGAISWAVMAVIR